MSLAASAGTVVGPRGSLTPTGRRVVKRKIDDSGNESSRNGRYATRTTGKTAPATEAGRGTGAKDGGSNGGDAASRNACRVVGRTSRLAETVLNVQKREPVQQSLMNDETLKDYGVLAVSEPYARLVDEKIVTSPMWHNNWTKMIPTQKHDARWPIRSMLWVRSDIEAKQLAVPSADLTAAMLRLSERDILVVSVYVQGNNEQMLLSAMETLHGLIRSFRDGTGRRTDVVLMGDFNRHNLLWTGDNVATGRQGEAEPIADLMSEHGLCSLLAEALGAENNVNIAKLSWLSKKESGKAYGSMVVYVTKESDARRLVDGHYFVIASESATTNVPSGLNHSNARMHKHAGGVQCQDTSVSSARRWSRNACRVVGRTSRLAETVLNVQKREPVQQSLMNDETLKDYGVLAVSEPYARLVDDKVVTSPMWHNNWTKMIPTQKHDARWPIRSMLWVRSDIEAKQLAVPSADLTAAMLRLSERDILVVSVYVQGNNEQMLLSAMETLHGLIRSFRDGTGRRTDVVLMGDFNRHNLLWTGDNVATGRQGEAEPIADLMSEHGLCSLLPRGTRTWRRQDQESTIDLVLATSELADEMLTCALHATDHGSDHQAIQTTFDVRLPERIVTPRLLFKNAPWNRIRTRVEEVLAPLPWTSDVQTQTDQLMNAVTGAVHDMTPQAKPSQYAKRWWTDDLTRLRRTYAFWRNHARARRRAASACPDLERRAKEAAKQYHDAIRNQRKSHWDEFLAEDTNIWKAAKYLEPGKGAMSDKVPPPRRVDGTTTTNRAEQSEHLLETFFPPLPAEIGDEGERPRREALAMPPLTMEEIEVKVMAAKPGIPIRIVKWVDAFCSARTASIVVNRHTSELQQLPQAGLPQGSPLSPVLFLLFNADLVQRRIKAAGGSIALIDDYSAWVTGPTAEANRAKRSGATFETDKTTIIHFTRTKARSSNTSFWVEGLEVKPKDSAKILGVIIDAGLRYREHVASAAAKGLTAAMGLKRLKMLSPGVARQLFKATVALAMDYASNVWMHARRVEDTRWLNKAQRIGAQAITGGFRTVATAVSEAEASIQSVEERHRQAATRLCVNLRTLPKTHPLTTLKNKTSKRYPSPLHVITTMVGRKSTPRVGIIHEYALPPWTTVFNCYTRKSVHKSSRNQEMYKASSL
ncbi:hypothetical protein PCL_09477 [Purpureocillium lilacinum]|uniref:Endonuclease/exonuclease/phosphatase domain-containing protein n=1 Tax=Purpureocillium lilacinum TaxID=33203 RepID=A0A2U3DQU0_PURLI|nr:hypothetical protein PCL_09477 [Purpureocillium lilacinum]